MKLTTEIINEIIKNTINDAAFKRLAKLPEEEKKEAEELTKTKSQLAQDAHNALFGTEKESFTYQINENIEVSNAEIEAFKEELTKHLIGHTVTFDTQTNNNVETIADFRSDNGTIDVVITGKIDNDWNFSFSLKKGLALKVNYVEITSENKELTSKLYNLYNSVFKTKFSSMIVN